MWGLCERRPTTDCGSARKKFTRQIFKTNEELTADMATLTTLPDLDTLLQDIIQEKPSPKRAWRVILYNDNHNSMENVVLWLQKATGCSIEVAHHVMHEAHANGRAVCYEGEKEKCQKVAGYLRGCGLHVEVDDLPAA